MPKELLPNARIVSRKRIVRYWKTHSGSGLSAGTRKIERDFAEIPSHSSAVTPGCGFALIDALEESASHADGIDIVVSFIKMSGLNLMIDWLRERAEEGTKIRAITTSFMGSTEAEAVIELASLPNTEVKFEFDATAEDHIHAKSFIFTSPNGNGEAYVGSANISKSALTTAEEWGIRIMESDLPDIFRELRDAYDKLWESPSLQTVSEGDRAKIEWALSKKRMGR
jgi:HKD family nuclease